MSALDWRVERIGWLDSATGEPLYILQPPYPTRAHGLRRADAVRAAAAADLAEALLAIMDADARPRTADVGPAEARDMALAALRKAGVL